MSKILCCAAARGVLRRHGLPLIVAAPAVTVGVSYSETHSHHARALAAAKAGTPMYVEKPLGIPARESLAMAKAIEKANPLFTTGPFIRTDSKPIFLKEEIARGD